MRFAEMLIAIALVSTLAVSGSAVQAQGLLGKAAGSVAAKATKIAHAALFGAALVTSVCNLQGCSETRFSLPPELTIDKSDVAKIELVQGIERSEVSSFLSAKEDGLLIASDYHGITIAYNVTGTDDSVGIGFAYAEEGFDDRIAVIDETTHTSVVFLNEIRSVAIEDMKWDAGFVASTSIGHAKPVWHPDPSRTMLAYDLLDKPDDGVLYSVVVAEMTDGMFLVKPVYAIWTDDNAAFSFLPFQGQIVNKTIFFLVDSNKLTISDSSILKEKEKEMSNMESLN